MKQLTLVLFASILSIGVTFGQSEQSNGFEETSSTPIEKGDNWCGANKQLNEAISKNPDLKIDLHERMLIASSFRAKQNLEKGAATKTVPVVVHILHDNGTGNITEEQVLDALEILNLDYNRLNADAGNTRNTANAPFMPFAASMDIEFKLAKRDPNGNCTNGIIRKNATSVTYNATDDCKYTSSGGSTAWPRDEYFNIWVVNSIENDGSAGIVLGYAQFPYWGNAATYGIVIRHDSFGSIGTAAGDDGNTLTHEVGHCFGLSHIFESAFGSDCSNGNACDSNGDYCCDTPPQSESFFSCSSSLNSCTTIPNGDAYGIDALDQIENFMSYNSCQNMFTYDQVNIMENNLIDYDWLAQLISPANVTASGVNLAGVLCEAEFSSDKSEICANSSVQFSDNSFHAVTGRTWTFNGGTPSSSTDENPIVTYDTPGTYSVTLQATDGVNAQTKTETNYITVLASPGNSMPIHDGFETASSLPNEDWSVGNPDNSHAWNVSTLAAKTGSKSLRLYNYGNQEGDIDEFTSTTYDLSDMASVTVSFQYAFAKKSSTNQDKLQFLVSYNCGETWVIRKTISSSQLPTSDNTTSNFTPSELEWEEGTVTNLTSTYFVDNFRFKFVFTSGGGNNVYIDDINIWGVDNSGADVGSPNMTSVNEFSNENSISLYPNPASDYTGLSFELTEESKNVQIGLFDIVGKKITTIHDGELRAGTQKFNISTQNLTKGIYLIVVNKEGKTLTKKLIIE